MPVQLFIASIRNIFLSLTVTCWLLGGMGWAQSFLFVSPNTRSSMSGDLAQVSLDSFEQANFLAVANYLGTRLCFKSQAWSGEGMAEENVENSVMVTGCKSAEARYLGELLGRYAHQKWILTFDSAPKGEERLLVITFPATAPADTPKEMRRFGIKAATVVSANPDRRRDQPEDKQLRVYLWVPDHSQDQAVHDFCAAHHGTIQEIAGTGTLIGSDSRASAQKIFDRRIAWYEQAHHKTLSKLLWSRKLHDLGLG
ncbi:MAG TPA: hypothetical protein VNV88_06810, partial [Candidatus Solibacter sp.]|nr:hypothetical protein [Candidatus Solibacter sp.]